MIMQDLLLIQIEINMALTQGGPNPTQGRQSRQGNLVRMQLRMHCAHSPTPS
jgi:hypothetical protein